MEPQASQFGPIVRDTDYTSKTYGQFVNNPAYTGATIFPYSTTTGKTIDTKTVSAPTVITSGNINNKVIPELNSKLQNLSNTGQSTGADGVTRYADGSIVPQNDNSGGNVGYGAPQQSTTSTSTTDTTDPDAGINSLLEQMKASLDSNTKAQIDQIHQNYEAKRTEQRKVNEFSDKAREASLLYGTTNGGSARYAQLSSSGIQTAQFQYGLDKINDLNNEEIQAVNAAKQAQESGNFQIMGKQLEIAEKRREEKQKKAEELAKTQAAELKTMREQNLKATRDSAIAEQFTISTDPATILKNLRAAGDKTTTLKDITDAIKDLTVENPATAAVFEILKGLGKNGAPSSVKEAVAKAQTVGEAFASAGDWLQEASGKAGEFLAYQRDARTRGKTPVSWDTFFAKDQEPNGGGGTTTVLDASGKPMTFSSNALAFAADYQKTGALPSAADMKYAGVTAGEIMNAAKSLPKYVSPAEKIAQEKKVTAAKSVAEFTKSKLETLNKILANPDDYQDATGANRTSVWNVVTKDKTDIILDIEQLVDQETLATLTELKKSGATLGAISEKELGILQSAATKIAKARKKNWIGDGIDGYDMSEQSFKEEITKMKKSAEKLIAESQEVEKQYAGTSTGDTLLASDDDAEVKINTFIAENPDREEEIKQHIQEMESENGAPISSIEFLQAFPEYQ